jgi:hypothetical protein
MEVKSFTKQRMFDVMHQMIKDQKKAAAAVALKEICQATAVSLHGKLVLNISMTWPYMP